MKKYLGLAAVTAVSMLAMAAPAFAATSGSETASVGVTAGVLAITSGGDISFPGVSLSGQQQVVNASLPQAINATDSTGSGAGWHVDVQASQYTEVAPSAGFATGTSALTLPTGSMSLDPVSGITASGTTSPDPTASLTATTLIDNGSAVQVASAAADQGMGSYNIAFPSNALTLTLNPATTFTDATNYASQATPYSSVITWTIVTGP